MSLKIKSRMADVKNIPPTPFEEIKEQTPKASVQPTKQLDDTTTPTQLPKQIENTETAVQPTNQLDSIDALGQSTTINTTEVSTFDQLDQQLMSGDWNNVVQGIIDQKYVVYPKEYIENVFKEHEVMSSCFIVMVQQLLAIQDEFGDENIDLLKQKMSGLQGKNKGEILLELTMSFSDYWKLGSKFKTVLENYSSKMKLDINSEDFGHIRNVLSRNGIELSKLNKTFNIIKNKEIANG